MLFLPGGVVGGGAVSGSAGGIVAARNRFGQYFRNRTVPVNPNTTQQQAVRANLSSLTTRWLGTLTPAQRSAWETYAANVPITNRVGSSVNATGFNWYVGNNALRLAATALPVDDAPTTYALATFSPISFTASEATQNLSITFATGDAWVSEDDAALVVFVSRPVSVTRNFFNGPFRFAGVVLGDSAVPPTSPQTIAAPFAFVAGQKLFVRANVFRADARIAAPQIANATAAA